MSSVDTQFFDLIRNSFGAYVTAFPNATVILDDTEKHVIVKNSSRFQLNIMEGTAPPEGGAVREAMKQRKKQIVAYPKEKYGVAVMIESFPLINEATGNVVGALTICNSRENEDNVMCMSNRLKNFSDELMLSSEELAESMQEVASDAQVMNSEITAIREEIAKLDEVIEYVKSVADTTNLLGLNAAIESARAGEQGKGFAVVANEIRKLAQNSKKSSDEINSTLKKVSVDINKIYDIILNFAAISEEQAAQTELVARNGQELRDLSFELLELSKKL